LIESRRICAGSLRVALAQVESGCSHGVAQPDQAGVIRAIAVPLSALLHAWQRYPIMTYPEVPPIEVVLLDRPELPSLGAGEGSVGPASAALANALANATGRRLRDLPLSPDRVKASFS
jgi:CO/xanthine dehydrogenase Mo-binding subunit